MMSPGNRSILNTFGMKLYLQLHHDHNIQFWFDSNCWAQTFSITTAENCRCWPFGTATLDKSWHSFRTRILCSSDESEHLDWWLNQTMCNCLGSCVRHVTSAVANAFQQRHAPLRMVRAQCTEVVYSGMSTTAMIAHAVNYDNQNHTKTSLN